MKRIALLSMAAVLCLAMLTGCAFGNKKNSGDGTDEVLDASGMVRHHTDISLLEHFPDTE